GYKIAIDKDIDETYATALLADPQTSGGLLIAVAPASASEVKDLLLAHKLCADSIGQIVSKQKKIVLLQK
ncbi:MAG: AIR synthase-related protein, partial [Puia sp.]